MSRWRGSNCHELHRQTAARAIERQGERWIVGANLAALEMPPTIHALLAARIERLRPEERTVLERASVVGRHFSRSAVSRPLAALVKPNFFHRSGRN